MTTIGRWLKDVRKRKRLKQKDLSAKTGISNVYISYYETGARPISAQHAVILAEALGVDPEEVVRRLTEGEGEVR